MRVLYWVRLDWTGLYCTRLDWTGLDWVVLYCIALYWAQGSEKGCIDVLSKTHAVPTCRTGTYVFQRNVASRRVGVHVHVERGVVKGREGYFTQGWEVGR
jgi:hypothetical protein